MLCMKIPRTESKTVEFKSAFNQDAIVAMVLFANADGGDVYVGVSDNGKVVGVSRAADPKTCCWFMRGRNGKGEFRA